MPPPPPRLWPDWENEFLACFFVRLPSDGSREDAFQRAEKILRSSRFKGMGHLVLRLPSQGPWLVADWLGTGSMPEHAMQALSRELGKEVLGFDRLRAHGTPTDSFMMPRFVDGLQVHGHTVKVEADGVTPVAGDKSRLPSATSKPELPAVSRTLQLPGTEASPLSGSEPSRTIRFIPVRGYASLALALAAIAAVVALRC
ncbi:MAG TPA: hypothetical protein VND93_30420 [Myxococcales bacterium]|nr:hypothetical protein [Myxococcales bacterium]